METHARITPVPSTVTAANSSNGSGGFQDSKFAREAERAARYRLVIEEGATKGTFIYKTLDRETGEVVRQLPREQVVKMAKDKGYDRGTLIDTSA